MAATDQMLSDWTKYLKDPNIKVRDVQAYGPEGGTLTRTATGATYKTPGGATWGWNAQNPDFGTQASRDADLAKFWKDQYGYELPGQSADTAETVKSFYDKSLPEAAQWKVNPATDTVEGRMAGLLDAGKPFIERARQVATTESLQGMNARGLANSSISLGAGVGAAEDAAYRAALPIAAQDASTYASSGQFNAGEQNRFGLSKLQGDIQSRLQAEQGKIQGGLQGAELASRERIAAASNALQTSLQTLKGTQATDLANIEAEFKTQIQKSDSTARIYQQMIDAMTTTMNSTQEPEAKKQVLSNQMAFFKTWLKMNSLPDIDLILDFTKSVPSESQSGASEQTAAESAI